MLYCRNIDIKMLDTTRSEKCRGGLRFHMENNHRPHFVFSSTEAAADLLPIILPPLPNACFLDLDPRLGEMSRPGDAEHITRMTEFLLPIIKDRELKVGWQGAFDAAGKFTGEGTCVFENGSIYKGSRPAITIR